MAPTAARRIIKYKHWATRPTSTPEMIRKDTVDLERTAKQMGTDLTGLRKVHLNFCHLVETNDPAKAREEQYPLYYTIMSGERGTDYFERCYLVGTPDEIRERLAGWQDVGVEEIVLAPLADPVKQYELWAKHFSDICDLG
jgi:alkanesulfonate monooxygenase SsuD/methylene tetrahydromethanopterin reductase-like flavin-dependent oxidoreductase (luciferase family)